jgi:hypothetical protein
MSGVVTVGSGLVGPRGRGRRVVFPPSHPQFSLNYLVIYFRYFDLTESMEHGTKLWNVFT